MIDTYVEQLSRLKSNLDVRKGQYQELLRQHQDYDNQLREINISTHSLVSIQNILSRIADKIRIISKDKLEQIVTSAIQFVFGPAFSFYIEMNQSSGKPQAEFYLVHEKNNQVIMTKPIDSHGGGVVDIISLALRIAVIHMHSNPTLNGPLVLDEPGKHVSEEYAEKMAQFLKHISNHFGRQIILITHQPYLAEAADKHFEVQYWGGQSHVAGKEIGN